MSKTIKKKKNKIPEWVKTEGKIPLHTLIKEKGKAPKEIEGLNFQQVVKKFSQPEWCHYPEAIHPLGCWSLIGWIIQSKNDCIGCDLSSDRIAAEKNPVIL